METIVQVKEVTKVYGKKNEKQTHALRGIDFIVKKGEFVGIMGASGSGKSTLLNILSTLDQPTAGQVTIHDRNLTSLKGDKLADFRAKEIGFIFQEFNLLETMTASENIAIPLSLQGVKPKEIKERIQTVATRLGITKILTQYPTELSGGQKQRVAAARALITQPAILLGDEPTGALDSKSAKDLLDMMEELNQKDQVSILLVTHDPFSASYCKRILFIKDGVIHKEVTRDGKTRNQFYQEILTTLGNLEQ
ncbi:MULTISPECIES: ABC transporter ATP-binding protein [Enterococcus]|uniref:ABC transporter ATP-binding protein n=1 Tax=Enterococcus sp. AZ102 TaxID=2774865 RepID=UPI003F27ABFC